MVAVPVLGSNQTAYGFSSDGLYFNGSTKVFTSPFYTATGTITGALTAGAFNYGALSYSDVNIFASYTSNVNTYNQIVLQNTNAGSAASSDYVVSNNLGTSGTYYGDFGINSSGWSGTSATPFNMPNAVYVSSTSGPLALGSTTSNPIYFSINGGLAATIDTTGLLTVPTGIAGGAF